MRRDELEKHPRSHLIDLIQQHNIKGYSKLNKTQLVDLIMKNKSKIDFSKLLPTPGEQKELKKYLKAQDKKDAMKKKIEKVNLEEKTTQSPKKKPTPKQMSELEQRTGKSRAEINKMSPAELVKFLPVELQEKIAQSGDIRVGTLFKNKEAWSRRKGQRPRQGYAIVIDIKKTKKGDIYTLFHSNKAGARPKDSTYLFYRPSDIKSYMTANTIKLTRNELFNGKKNAKGNFIAIKDSDSNFRSAPSVIVNPVLKEGERASEKFKESEVRALPRLGG